MSYESRISKKSYLDKLDMKMTLNKFKFHYHSEIEKFQAELRLLDLSDNIPIYIFRIGQNESWTDTIENGKIEEMIYRDRDMSSYIDKFPFYSPSLKDLRSLYLMRVRLDHIPKHIFKLEN